jgi:hypothetical protein
VYLRSVLSVSVVYKAQNFNNSVADLDWNDTLLLSSRYSWTVTETDVILLNWHVVFYLLNVIKLFMWKAINFYSVYKKTGVDKRRTDGGQRTADDGRRTADDGRRTTDDGRRTTDGGRRTTDGGRRTADDGRRTTDGGRRTADDGRRTTDGGPRSIL